MDIGACFNGYWGDLTRTWVCGTVRPTAEMRDLHQKCYDALFDAGSKIRPGATNADVFAAADPYVLDSLGHGAGVNPWEAPYFSPASKDSPVILKQGMVFSILGLMPGRRGWAVCASRMTLTLLRRMESTSTPPILSTRDL